MKEYDVVIAGAGPAGSTSAYYLAKSGLRVCLLDRCYFPREKTCGGGLCSHVSKFSFIDKSFFKTASSAATIYGSRALSGVEYAADREIVYQTDRKYFDHHLCLHAVKAGADFIENERVTNLQREGHRLHVYTSGGKYTGRAVIGAGGVFCPVATSVRKQNGLPSSWDTGQLFYCLVSEIPVDESEIEKRFGKGRNCVLFFPDHIRGGYAWAFPKKNSVNAGLGSYISALKSYGAFKAFYEYIDLLKHLDYLPQEQPCADIKGGVLPAAGPLKKTYTDNILLAGDAAGFVSAFSGEGIYYAMDSGRIASEVLLRSFEKGRLDAEQLSSYQSIWTRKWGRDLKMLSRFNGFLHDNVERIIRYARNDEKFLDLAGGIMMMEERPTKSLLKVMRSIVRSIILQHIGFSGIKGIRRKV